MLQRPVESTPLKIGGITGPLLHDVLTATAAPVHAIGHSYGAKVVMSAIAAKRLPRKVKSVLLLQPAISHLAFAEAQPGPPQSAAGCRARERLLDELRTVAVSSSHDRIVERGVQRKMSIYDLRQRRRQSLRQRDVTFHIVTLRPAPTPWSHWNTA